MLPRRAITAVRDALNRQAAVALIGPRQVGKTTLARAIAAQVPSVYLDLETPTDRAKLSDPGLFLRQFSDRLVVLDEIHRVPDIFLSLRGIIDQGRREGRKTGRFLVLGSAALSLLRQSGETLAGRIAFIDIAPFDALEIAEADVDTLWIRGGFPDSYLAADDRLSMAWRSDFIRTCLERDVPAFSPRIAGEAMGRLWTMLAHDHGAMLNALRLAGSLMVSAPSVTRYIDLLTDLFLLRRLPPYFRNIGKRLVKSPKIYIRDSGLVHTLLGISDFAALQGHPVAGASWEGFVIENLINAAPDRTLTSFFRTAAGAEIDLILEPPGRGLWAFDIKRSPSARPQRGFHLACDDLKPDRRIQVSAGDSEYETPGGVEVKPLLAIMRELAGLSLTA